MYDLSPDIAVIGAGFAGLCTAHRLAAAGHSTTLIDRSDRCPSTFRAEKLEPDQADLLRRLDLLELRRPVAAPFGECTRYDGVRVTTWEKEQYGISYRRTVDSLRDALPDRVVQRCASVNRIVPDPRRPRVELTDGRSIMPRLVVVATGGNDRLLGPLGISRARRPELVSLSFGFDIESLERGGFPFNGFNYEPGPNPIVDFVTIFPIGDRMRVNLFTSLTVKDSRIRRFKEAPLATLAEWFDGILEYTGRFRVSSTVRVAPTSFYRVADPARPGVVLVGDEFQSVHPGTGKGLSRALTDVTVLCDRYVPVWLANRRITVEDIGAYYRDPDKAAADHEALDRWYYYHDRSRGDRATLAERLRRRLRKVA